MKRLAILLLLAGLLLTSGCAYDYERRQVWLEATSGTFDGDSSPR